MWETCRGPPVVSFPYVDSELGGHPTPCRPHGGEQREQQRQKSPGGRLNNDTRVGGPWFLQ